MTEATGKPDLPWDVFELIHAHQTAERGMAVDLMTTFQERAAKAQIELELVRDQVMYLFNGPYQPSEWAVKQALWVDQNAVNEIYERRQPR